MTEHTWQSAADAGRVAVLMGGWSAERDISLKSGAAILEALRGRGVDAHAFDPRDRALPDLLGFDRALVALHGRGGEDGAIQGALETLGIPYTGSGVLGSAVAMDKLRTKLIWRGLDLATPPFRMLGHATDWDGVVDELGLPLMVKPANEGSSLGMSRVGERDGLEAAWIRAADYDTAVFAERWITGEEYTVAVLDGECLPAIRIESARGFYDFDAKYVAEDTRMHCPCGLPADTERALGELALSAFEATGAEGWGRVDLMRDGDGRFWLLEVNTVPGMTDHSLVPAAARVAGLDMGELVWRILATSRARGGER
ncbi:D-alanine--D-alanine ligase [wastewater metagenome]|uniref:D-alanine--D-alanine ligase n=2 Tax=unclassified sequences TaxID=12908 RepID=A0A5B8RC60_9ZZZZ|nr:MULTISPECIES: D-alanine--D-alanine ligase [Arhodomonas]MCS4504701.1 D-alanine--D-alanine ligase [Arhodomonas aquaeolei]QEA04982.1 D-alanine--D-alanine ligase [uncultured organism]